MKNHLFLLIILILFSGCDNPPKQINETIKNTAFRIKKINLTEYHIRYNSDELFSKTTQKYLLEYIEKMAACKYPYNISLNNLRSIELINGQASKKKFEQYFNIEDYSKLKPLPLFIKGSEDSLHTSYYGHIEEGLTYQKYYWYSSPNKKTATIATFFDVFNYPIPNLEKFLKKDFRVNFVSCTMFYPYEERATRFRLKMKLDDKPYSYEDSVAVYNYLKDEQIDLHSFFTLADTLYARGRYWKEHTVYIKNKIAKIIPLGNFELGIADSPPSEYTEIDYQSVKIDTLCDKLMYEQTGTSDYVSFSSNFVSVIQENYIKNGDRNITLIRDYKLELNRRYEYVENEKSDE